MPGPTSASNSCRLSFCRCANSITCLRQYAKSCLKVSGQAGGHRADLVGLHAEIVTLPLVQVARVLAHRRVAIGGDVVEHAAHGLLDVRRVLRWPSAGLS
jgi:hypothetical protein